MTTGADAGYDVDQPDNDGDESQTPAQLSATPKRKSSRANNQSTGVTTAQLTWGTVCTVSAGPADVLLCTPPCSRLPHPASWITLQCAGGGGGSSSSSGGASSSTSSSSVSRLGTSSDNATPQWFLGSPRVHQLRVAESTKRDSLLEFDFKGMHFSRLASSSAATADSVGGEGDVVANVEHQVSEAVTTAAAGTVAESTLSKTAQKSCNPFEHDLDTMHLSSFSPSVFSKVVTPSKDEAHLFGHGTFNWGIENAAILYPNNFEEDEQQAVSTPCDQETEEKYQNAINLYFSKNNCVPSPWLLSHSKNMDFSPHLASTVHIANHVDRRNSVPAITCNASTQTTLTLPMDFDLEKVLANYFTYTSPLKQEDCGPDIEWDTRESLSTSGTSSLRRKLFVNDETQASPSCLLGNRLNLPSSDDVSFPACMNTPIKNGSGTMEQLTSPNMDFISPDVAGIGRAHCHSLSPSMTVISPTVSPICLGDVSNGDSINRSRESNDCVSMMSISSSQPNTPLASRDPKKKTVRDCNRSLDMQIVSTVKDDRSDCLPNIGPDNLCHLIAGGHTVLATGGPSWLESLTGTLPSTISFMETSSTGMVAVTALSSISSSSTNQETGYYTLSSGAPSCESSLSVGSVVAHHSGQHQSLQPPYHTHQVDELTYLPLQPSFNSLLPIGSNVWSPLGSSTPSRTQGIFKGANS